METSPPETFIAFLQAIIHAETHADQWKSKLFYFSPQQILATLNHHTAPTSVTQQEGQNSEKLVAIDSLVSFIQKHIQSQGNPNPVDSQKVISKYFGFIQSTTCPSDRFFQRLKPTDNKLILEVEKEGLKLQQCLSGLFKCIFSGYQKIKLKREDCACNMHLILQYFHNQMGFYKGLSKEALKEITFEANIYGRISFSYLREYIFGHDQEIIGWETLFGVKMNEAIEKIQELSEENIVSEKFIIQDKSRVFTPKQNVSECPASLTPDHQSICLESVSEIKGISETVSINKLTHPQTQDYSKVLNEINQIQSLLNKTKERYQKNRQDLQNQTQVIRTQHLRRSQNIGKFSSTPKYASKYENLKISESREKVVPSTEVKCEKKENAVSCVSIWQNASTAQKIEPKSQSPYKSLKQSPQPLEQSIIFPLMTRQEMRRETTESNESHVGSSVASGQSTMRSRQAGKIRRSMSKDIDKVQVLQQSLQQRYSENTFSNTLPNYSEYESVLMEIKREESKFKKMVEDREKILYGRTSVRGEVPSSLKNHRKSPSYSSLTGEYAVNKSIRESKTFTFQNIPINSRCSEIMREIENGSALNTSRISSKKREEIVQKATSQARLRIQDIQNRALKRIAKFDTSNDTQEKQPIVRNSSYLKIDSTQTSKPETPKFTKPLKQNTTSMIKSQKIPKNNFFLNDLLNERPGLKLTTISSIYQTKY